MNIGCCDSSPLHVAPVLRDSGNEFHSGSGGYTGPISKKISQGIYSMLKESILSEY